MMVCAPLMEGGPVGDSVCSADGRLLVIVCASLMGGC